MIDLDQTTFEAEVQRAGDNLSPVRAGLLLARECAYPELQPSDCLAQLANLATDAQPYLRGLTTFEAQGAALAEFLFQTDGFRGNRKDYTDPRNSYLNQVLERRLGLPISLSVIFIDVAEQLGLPVAGIGLPGHFIVSVAGANEPVYLDPFNIGRRLTVADCAELAQNAMGRAAGFNPDWLRPAAQPDIVARMINNLRGFYVAVEDWPMAIGMLERLIALQPAVATHLRDLGVLHYRNGALGRASQLLNEYLLRNPSAPDGESIRQGRDRLREELARLN